MPKHITPTCTPSAPCGPISLIAYWGMQFIRPIKAEYRIIFVDPDYQYTIIGRSKRDYVWIMSRKSALAPSVYNMLLQILVEEGYDKNKLRIVPQNDGPAKDLGLRRPFE